MEKPPLCKDFSRSKMCRGHVLQGKDDRREVLRRLDQTIARAESILDEVGEIDVDAALTVREIAPGDFNYYLYDSGNLRLFEISLEKDGKPIALTAPVKVMFPEAYCRAVYRFKDGIFTDAQAASDTSGYRTVRTDTLGLFVTSKTDTPPKAEKYGNVDGDDVITIVDVSYIQRHLAGIRKFDADQIRIADVDGDGDVTIVDGAYIQRWLAGMLSDNPMTRFGYPKQ